MEAVSRFFGLPLERDPELEEIVRRFWAMRHSGHCPKTQFKQAMIPHSATKIENRFGSASGVFFDTVFDKVSRRIYVLPGPPNEFLPMMQESVIPQLAERAGNDKVYTLGFLACGTGEQKVSAIVRQTGIPDNLLCAYTASSDGCRFYLSGTSESEVREQLERVRTALGCDALEIGELSLEEKLISLLKEKNMTLATAESCTGGLISSKITNVPGASSVYIGSAVTYSNEMKQLLLQVSADTLEKYGAVSSETAYEMALGAWKNLKADATIAVTGIAGPGGGTPEKPVGLVYAGICVKGEVHTIELRLRGNRDMVRARTCSMALLELLKTLRGEC
jgi:nicotinamide-nucleotide amidase